LRENELLVRMVADAKGDTMEWKERTLLLGVLIYGGNSVKGLATAQPVWKVHLSSLLIRLYELTFILGEVLSFCKTSAV